MYVTVKQEILGFKIKFIYLIHMLTANFEVFINILLVIYQSISITNWYEIEINKFRIPFKIQKCKM